LTIVSGISAGDVIAEKYRVERVLGAGGMGVVVAARHLQLDDEVAIKFLSAEMLGDEMAISRFDREARASAKIKNEHVVRVFDVGRLPNGAPYMVMERLYGSDLTTWLRHAGQLPIEQAADFVVQACVALAEAHRLGIVHRDIKPSNLFCVKKQDQSASIKVLDFGISKLTLASAPVDGSITATATAIGSPSYMSPEQMRSANRVDHRTDIWSLGVVLYELLTGKLPFRGATYPEICLKVAGEAPDPPRLYRAELTEALQDIVLKCLEKDRERRFANVVELAEALLAFAPARARHAVEQIRGQLPSAQPISAQPSLPVELRQGLPPTSTWGKSTWGKSSWSTSAHALGSAKQRRRLLLGAAGAALLVVSAVSVALLGSRASDEAPGATAVSAQAASPSSPIAAGHDRVPEPVPARQVSEPALRAAVPRPIPPPVLTALEPAAAAASVTARPPAAASVIAIAPPSAAPVSAKKPANSQRPAVAKTAPVVTPVPPLPPATRSPAADPARRSKTSVWTKRE